MKHLFLKIALCAFVALLAFGTVAATAYEPFSTYTYTSEGMVVESPAAYSSLPFVVDSTYMREQAVCQDFVDILEPTDILAGPDGRIYIVDQKNNQIVVLNKHYKAEACLNVFDSDERDGDTFNAPTGVFVNENYIYVCDTQNSRIVRFNAADYSFSKVISQPVSPLMKEDALFLPIAMAIDQYNRMFVLSSSSYEGVIVMDEESNFTGYIGAPKVTSSLIDIIWREFQTEEQRANNITYIPTQFQNIAIDAEGFIYVTSSTVDENKQLANLSADVAARSGDYAPVRKLNSAGKEITKRNGFFDCGGEVVTAFDSKGVSKIADVACGPEGTFSIIDTRRSRTYTYNSNGDLLFAFGDAGGQIGNINSIKGITYQGSNLLLLDYTACAFTVYARTSYGDLLAQALHNDNERLYDQSIDYWLKVLQFNNNFDAAYIGVGKAHYLRGEYKEAMEYLESAYETNYYGKAYAEVRKDWIAKFIWVIPLVAGAFIFGLVKLFKYTGKVNHKATYKVGKKTYWEELVFAFHLCFHPFDGFWDLKHEKRGSVRGAFTILGMTVLAFYYMSVGRGYLANPTGAYSGLLVQILSIFLPVALFALGNWCLTTLFDGEGSFKDIFITTSYALSPIPPVLVITTLLTNITSQTGVELVQFINILAFVWAGLLLFLGIQVTHDYSMGKNFITLISTVLSMAVIMFAAVLFSSLVTKMISFVSSIVTEISFRM